MKIKLRKLFRKEGKEINELALFTDYNLIEGKN